MAVDKSKFFSSGGHFLTRTIFWETTLADKTGVVYTLKEEPHDGYPSLYQAYMACDDPTEYTFAKEHLAGWEHWLRLCACNWFKPYIKLWREELEIKTKAKALANIKAFAKEGGKDSYQANKFLLGSGWVDKKSHGRGRPSKDQIKQEAERIARDRSDLDEDFQRITGTVQ